MLMLKLAFRNILRNKRRTILTMLSMFGGYTLLVLSISVQNGSYDQVIKFFTKDSTGHAQIVDQTYLDRPTLYKSVPATDQFYQQLMALDSVTHAVPRIVSGALAYGEAKSFPVQVLGVDVEKEASTSFLTEKINQGRYFSANPNNEGYYEVMVGGAVARQLSVSVGDELILISQGSDGSLANDLYQIVGLVGATDGADARNVYLPLAAAQDFYVMQDKAHYWAVLTYDFADSDQLAQTLNTWLSNQPDTNLEAASWKVVSKEFYEAMTADIEGGYISYYIIVILICIGVLNTVLMSVLERTGEFGVLKAIGTSPKRIFSLIVLETLMLAVFSCVAGFIVSLPINYYLAKVGITLPDPVEFSGITMSHMQGLWNISVFTDPALIIIGSAAFISLFPARRAAKIVPVEAMRSL
ncbi:ABC transporter permease [Reinekea sp.]|jgi:putative ABC transport system permease protein|uniref:ABC transporter permease n=1 Tax=Reinekea sp. TaxID=1970455 RepID=UPI0039891E90